LKTYTKKEIKKVDINNYKPNSVKTWLTQLQSQKI